MEPSNYTKSIASELNLDTIDHEPTVGELQRLENAEQQLANIHFLLRHTSIFSPRARRRGLKARKRAAQQEFKNALLCAYSDFRDDNGSISV